MPTLNLTADDREYLTGASAKAREWMERNSRAFSVGEAEREVESICGPADPLQTLSSMGMTMSEAAQAFNVFNQRARDWSGELHGFPVHYRARYRPWSGDIWERDYYERERQVDEGPFITFGYPWVHGQLNVNSGLLEVQWVNRTMDASTGLYHIECQDGSEFNFGTLQESSNGVYIGGPFDGERMRPHDYEWIMADLGNGRTGNRFHFRQPEPLNFARRLDSDLVTPPTFSQVTYTGTIFHFPHPSRINSGSFRFLVLRLVP